MAQELLVALNVIYVEIRILLSRCSVRLDVLRIDESVRPTRQPAGVNVNDDTSA
jgi:hypothetical protein